MKKKTTGIIAGAAGAALLMGGGTFALWSDSAEVPDTTITSGNLAVDVVATGCDVAEDIGGEAPTGTWHWIDTSSDRTDSPHWINANDFRIVPGDTVEGLIGLDLALEGENIVAQLGANLGQVSQNGAKITGFSVLDSDCEVIPLADAFSLDLASEDNGNPGDATIVGATADGTADLTAVVQVSFPESIGNQDHVDDTVLSLSGASVTLNQVRDGHGAPGYEN